MSQNNGKAGANGTAKDNGKVVANTQMATPPKPELSNIVIPIGKTIDEPKKELPIADRFLKLDELHAIRLRWDKLKDTLDKLNKFKLSTDSKADNIILSDGRGNQFSTYNPEVVAKVIELLKEDVTKRLSETEASIIF